MMQVKSRYTYLSHDHNFVAWQVMLFDSLSENNFGTPIGIGLIIAIQVKKINLEMKRKGADLTHIGSIESIDSCIITCHRNYRQNQIAISWILILTLP